MPLDSLDPDQTVPLHPKVTLEHLHPEGSQPMRLTDRYHRNDGLKFSCTYRIILINDGNRTIFKKRPKCISDIQISAPVMHVIRNKKQLSHMPGQNFPVIAHMPLLDSFGQLQQPPAIQEAHMGGWLSPRRPIPAPTAPELTTTIFFSTLQEVHGIAVQYFQHVLMSRSPSSVVRTREPIFTTTSCADCTASCLCGLIIT